ncbi:hypothetical protein [Kitasatospora indigofera]|uniref:hypothetical protein n=1 Tax=Kitasatospora indigofera TaxID=67307 RepID=UPI003681B363
MPEHARYRVRYPQSDTRTPALTVDLTLATSGHLWTATREPYGPDGGSLPSYGHADGADGARDRMQAAYRELVAAELIGLARLLDIELTPADIAFADGAAAGPTVGGADAGLWIADALQRQYEDKGADQ